MHNFDKFFIFVFLLLLAGRVEAKITLSEQELKGKMIDDKILSIYLSREGIVASGLNQHGVPEEEDYIVLGSYNKIPEELHKLAQAHRVTILPSQRVSNYQAILPFIPWIMNIIIFIVIIVVLISINKKLSRILETLLKRQ